MAAMCDRSLWAIDYQDMKLKDREDLMDWAPGVISSYQIRDW